MARPKFRYLSHTADVELVGYGKDVKEAIENSALAMLSVALDVKKIERSKGPENSIVIKEKADKIENLIWFVLQDILSKKEALGLSTFRFKVDALKEEGAFSLRGRLFYKKLKENYALLDVKAVTPHDLKVIKNMGGYSIDVTLDV